VDSFLKEFEKLNIKFGSVDKPTAEAILRTEHPYYRLLEYSVLFDRYERTEKKGKFVNLDFGQLYSLVKIDEELCNIVLCDYLEIERTLKARVLDYKLKYAIPDDVVSTYVATDEEYLSKIYKSDTRQILLKYHDMPIKDLSLEAFLDIIQGGTFDRFYNYLYKNYINGKEEYYGSGFYSAYRLRNVAAHYNSLLPQLLKPTENPAGKVSAYLGKHFNKKTFSTNMSKSVIYDVCNMLYLYCTIEPEYKLKQNYARWNNFLTVFCAPYFGQLCTNNMLVSAYTFISRAVEVFRSGIKQ